MAIENSKSPADRRARIRPKSPEAWDYLTGRDQNAQSLLSILRSTGGMVFPYTPTINEEQSVSYDTYETLHSNQGMLAYARTNAVNLTVSGEFTAQTKEEAYYMIACIHFLRSMMKMDFGQKASRPGLPPPILLFSAYGTYMFNNLPVVITGFQPSYPADVDYVRIPLLSTGAIRPETFGDVNSGIRPWSQGEDIYVPSETNLTVNLTVQQTPDNLREEFSLTDFKSGNLLLKNQGRGGWI